jgi:hypothetical protein
MRCYRGVLIVVQVRAIIAVAVSHLKVLGFSTAFSVMLSLITLFRRPHNKKYTKFLYKVMILCDFNLFSDI